MPGLLIIAHAPLASSLKTVAQHAFPQCEVAIEAIDVLPDQDVGEIEKRARECLQRVRDPDALVLTDVFGATPSNVARLLAEDSRVRVIAGVNVPMLWRTLCYSSEPLDALVERALSGATQGVVRVDGVGTRPPPASAADR